jgi:hypothetical protein
MSNKVNRLKVGASVRAAINTHDPDLGGDIGGWVGRILEIREDVIHIQWDSITLSAMPGEMISACEERGLDWSSIFLSPAELEPANAQDTIRVCSKII